CMYVCMYDVLVGECRLVTRSTICSSHVCTASQAVPRWVRTDILPPIVRLKAISISRLLSNPIYTHQLSPSSPTPALSKKPTPSKHLPFFPPSFSYSSVISFTVMTSRSHSSSNSKKKEEERRRKKKKEEERRRKKK